MMDNTGKQITLSLAGIRIKVVPVDAVKLAQRLAGYEDKGLPKDASEIVIRIKPEDVAKEKEQTLCLWERLGIVNPDVEDSYFELTCLFKKVLNELIWHYVIYLHGSAVSVDGQGYLFIAPSGTGKSTHARLWRERYGNEVVMINDDKPFVRFTDEEIYLCGNPWNGKHGIGNPVEAPLRAIIRLQRGAENVIEPLDQAQALKQLFIQSHQFRDKEKMQIVLQLLGRILENVPCYTLYCNMDLEAAKVAREGLQHCRKD